jgi:hypothetical protein
MTLLNLLWFQRYTKQFSKLNIIPLLKRRNILQTNLVSVCVHLKTTEPCFNPNSLYYLNIKNSVLFIWWMHMLWLSNTIFFFTRFLFFCFFFLVAFAFSDAENLQLFDGHNGSAAAIYARENLLNNVLNAIPPDLNRDEWVTALPRALVAGFVKTDKDFQQKGMANYAMFLLASIKCLVMRQVHKLHMESLYE